MDCSPFCPIGSATEILGERWTIPIVRELLVGGRRFGELQRGPTPTSPTLLSKRLDSLTQHGPVMRRRIGGQKGFECLPTRACEERLPIITAPDEWGMRWAQSNITQDDHDVELPMPYLQRSIRPDNLPTDQTTLRFHFTDIETYPDWWIVVRDRRLDLYVNDAGREVEVYFTITVKTMADVWMGRLSYRKAMAEKALTMVGRSALINPSATGMQASVLAGIEPQPRPS